MKRKKMSPEEKKKKQFLWNKKWNEKNPEKRKEIVKKYNERTKDKRRKYAKEYQLRTWDERKHTLKQRFWQAKYNAKRCGRSFEINFEEYCKIILDNKCHYCWQEVLTGGSLDRKNNEEFYAPNNVVCCCWRCNATFRDDYTYIEKLMLAEIIRKIDSIRPKINKTKISGCFIIEIQEHTDSRGSFQELFHQPNIEAGLKSGFSCQQSNCSISNCGVVRGIHISPFAKLITCLKGSILDVVVDMRENSPTYLQWISIKLDSSEKQVYVPSGCGHGFFSYEDKTIVIYSQTGVYNPAEEKSVHWRDKTLNIQWPHALEYIVSQKDSQAPFLELTNQKLVV